MTDKIALGRESGASDRCDKNTPGWFSFEGRARRSEYWAKCIWMFLLAMFVALPLIIAPICTYANSDFGGLGGGAIVCIVLGILLAIFCGIAMWPVTVRRLHDRGMSGWWIIWFALLNCIPFVGWIAGIVQFVIVGCMDGIPGPNEYGPDPKGRNWVQGTSSRPIVGIVNNNTNVNATHGGNAEERLSKLEELKNKGLISAVEYETKRNQILSEI